MPARFALFAVLFTASGVAGLIYQVVWMRALGLLFGNTAAAAGAALAAFFTGLALGGAVLGRRAHRLRQPLRVFAWLEGGVVVAAGGVLLLLPLYTLVFPWLYRVAEDLPAVLLLVKLLLALLCLVPAAFCMGGTLPVLAEVFATEPGTLGRRAGTLYALNTLGAAAGAFLAAFVLPREIGYRSTLFVAMGVSASVATIAWLASRGSRRAVDEVAPAPAALPEGQPALMRTLAVVAAVSGVAVLAFEVLWTKLLAAGLQSSVYTFGAILVVVLLALTVGAGLAQVAMRRRWRWRPTLGGLLVATGLLMAWGPPWHDWVQELLAGPGGSGGFPAYLRAVFMDVALTVGPTAVVAGAVFPFVLHVAGDGDASGAPGSPATDAGRITGRLIAINTVGGIAGALLAAFVLAPWVGPRLAAALLGVIPFVCGVGLLLGSPAGPRAGQAVLAGGGALLLGALGLGVLQSERGLIPEHETLVQAYHGSAGTVAVSQRGDGALKLRLDRGYALGGTAEPRWERLQAHIPLLLHPKPERVFFIGMGTGITAGGALAHAEVKRVVVSELVPEVVEAARDHFYSLAGGLFEDPRVALRTEDARTILRGTDEQFDVIVGDLFLPWKRGVGAVYTREQLQAGRARLRPGGLYAQWLPLYQLSVSEFLTIAHTFTSVFPQVTVWRGDFFSKRPIVALIGHRDLGVLDADAFEARYTSATKRGLLGVSKGGASLGFHLYAGTLRGRLEAVASAAISTDDHPWIEFTAPIHARARRARHELAFTETRWLAFLDQLHVDVPPASDPFLAAASASQRRWVEGGRFLHAYAIHGRVGAAAERRAAWRDWLLRVPTRVRPDLSDWVR